MRMDEDIVEDHRLLESSKEINKVHKETSVRGHFHFDLYFCLLFNTPEDVTSNPAAHTCIDI